ncbi:hypothetical protein GX865_03610 [Candidatus Saccharibacteria bacterium]|jgi:hypothetical protein|nr:hypothetical protein [Candidatus Saccharibacteria bacterium]
MDFLRVSRQKNIFSEFLYILLNVAFVAVLFFLMYVSGQVYLALILVLLSKWRILAVRMRYWRANILANLVDISVGFGVVGLMYLANSAEDSVVVWLQLVISILYAVWLTAIKPLSSKKAMLVQSLIGLFVGTWSVMALSYMIPLPIVVILLFIVGYGVARHVLTVHEETQLSLLSMVFGFMLAEIGWVMYHWTIGYGLVNFGDLKIPQAAIFMTLGGLAVERMYAAITLKKSVKSAEYLAPAIFSIVTILVLLVMFSSVGAGIV